MYAHVKTCVVHCSACRGIAATCGRAFAFAFDFGFRFLILILGRVDQREDP